MALREDLALDITSALRDIDRLESTLARVAGGFSGDLARALDQLGTQTVKVAADTTGIGSEVEGAVDSAETTATVEADTSGVGAEVEGAVDAADSTVTVEADTTGIASEIEAAIDAADSTVNIDTGDAAGGLGEIEGASLAAGVGLGRLGTTGTAALAGIAAAGAGAAVGVNELNDSIQLAAGLEEIMNRIDVVFGDVNEEVLALAENAPRTLALAKDQALAAGAEFGDLFTSAGATGEELDELAASVVRLSVDLSSFRDIGVPEVLERLRSGLVGEAESLRRLGIFMSAAEIEAKALEQRVGGVTGEITEQEKLLARYSLILEKTTLAQGDFARTADSVTNQQRTLTAEFREAQLVLGEELLPVMPQLIGAARDLIPPITELAVSAVPVLVAGVEVAVPILGALAGVLGVVADVVGAAEDALGFFNVSLVDVLGTASGAFGLSGLFGDTGGDEAAGEIEGVGDAAADTGFDVDGLQDSLVDAIAGLGAAGAAADETQTRFGALGDEFADTDAAVREIVDAFDDTIGRAFDVLDAESALADNQARLVDLRADLNEELTASAQEMEAVQRAARSLTDAEESLVDAQEDARDAAVDLAEAQQRVDELRATESERIARELAEAENDLARSKLNVLELEQRLAGLQSERADALDPAKAAELASLQALRAQIGAAPPSFLREIDQRIKALVDEIGPEAIAELDLDIQGLQLDIADAKLAVEDATQNLADTQEITLTGTEELRDAQDAATDAAEKLADANDKVADASRTVAERQRAVQDAYRNMQPDQRRVRDLQREIESAQRDSITAAVDLAATVARTSGESGDALEREFGGALDAILDRFPDIEAEMNELAARGSIGLAFNVDFAALVNPFTDLFTRSLIEAVDNANLIQRDSSGQIVGLRAAGGTMFGGELGIVGEAGAEFLVAPPQGARILSHEDSLAAAAAGVRDAVLDSLGRLSGSGSSTSISVVAPSTDARSIVDETVRANREAAFLRGST